MGELERLNELLEIIETRINPFCLNESGRVTISNLLRKYSYDFLVECVDLSYERYIERDDQGELTKNSVEEFLSKVGGIAYNQSLSPIDKATLHVMNVGKKCFSYWDPKIAKSLLEDYVSLHRFWGWNEEEICSNMEGKLIIETKRASCWSQWRDMMELLVGEYTEDE